MRTMTRSLVVLSVIFILTKCLWEDDVLNFFSTCEQKKRPGWHKHMTNTCSKRIMIKSFTTIRKSIVISFIFTMGHLHIPQSWFRCATPPAQHSVLLFQLCTSPAPLQSLVMVINQEGQIMLDFIKPVLGHITLGHILLGGWLTQYLIDLDIEALWSIKVQLKCCKNSFAKPRGNRGFWKRLKFGILSKLSIRHSLWVCRGVIGDVITLFCREFGLCRDNALF